MLEQRGRIAGWLLCFATLPFLLALQSQESPLEVLPPHATTQLARSLDEAEDHRPPTHVWRDTSPTNDDGSVNAYVEISRGDRRKWEFDMWANARAIDRVIPTAIGGYPVNYGFVPQTIFYDGDPFDALVLGPPLPADAFVRGVIVGVMGMEDEKGPDSKVVLSPIGRDGHALFELTADAQRTIADYFDRYKQFDANGFSRVTGWGSREDGLAHVTAAHRFFNDCRSRPGVTCNLSE